MAIIQLSYQRLSSLTAPLDGDEIPVDIPQALHAQTGLQGSMGEAAHANCIGQFGRAN